MDIFFDQTFSELSQLLNSWGEPQFRALQVWKGVYGNYWSRPDEFTNLPAVLRARLFSFFDFTVLEPINNLESSDKNTIKTLFKLADGNLVEAVLMKYDRRNTLCISTQVGCAMDCIFCATGKLGFTRHLSSGEIVGQVMYYARLLAAQQQTVSNVVIMGMGEPFHNYENTLKAIDTIGDPQGYNFGARRITISTVGLVPAIKRFTQEKRQVNLAVSLHAADDATRASLLPVAKAFPLEDLISACREYTIHTGRRITFEWALIRGVNDTPAQAELLIRLVKGLLCHVNLIRVNPTPGFDGESTTYAQALQFQETLTRAGIACTLRQRRGIDIQAGCGQLLAKARE
jgi:23S rRNA (adenine2503-C2)-methyltransferase